MSEVGLALLKIFFGIQLELEIQTQIDLKSLYSIVKFGPCSYPTQTMPNSVAMLAIVDN